MDRVPALGNQTRRKNMTKSDLPIPWKISRFRTSIRLAGAMASLVITLAPLASAGTIGISGGSLIIGTEPGDGSQAIFGSTAGQDILFTGINFDLVTPGCTGSGPGSFLCPVSGFTSLF